MMHREVHPALTSSIQIITYYAATIFQNNIGLGAFTSRLLAALNGTEYFVASWVAIFTIEKFGRRKLMIFGAVGQAVSHPVHLSTQVNVIHKADRFLTAVHGHPRRHDCTREQSFRYRRRCIPLRLQFVLRCWVARDDLVVSW